MYSGVRTALTYPSGSPCMHPFQYPCRIDKCSRIMLFQFHKPYLTRQRLRSYAYLLPITFCFTWQGPTSLPRLRVQGPHHSLQSMTAAATGPAADGTKPRRIVLWFRNDLRLRDNVIVRTAAEKISAKEADEVRPGANIHPLIVPQRGTPQC